MTDKSKLSNISDNHWKLLLGQIKYSEYLKAEGYNYKLFDDVTEDDISYCFSYDTDTIVPICRNRSNGKLTIGYRKKDADDVLDSEMSSDPSLDLMEIADYDFERLYRRYRGYHKDFPPIPASNYVDVIKDYAIKNDASDITTYVEDGKIKVMFKIRGVWNRSSIQLPEAEEKAFITALTGDDISAHDPSTEIVVTNDSIVDATHIGRNSIIYTSADTVTTTTRISERTIFTKTIDELNLNKDVCEFMRTCFASDTPGLRVVVGKPGSGKNWTILASLKELLSDPNKKVVVVGNPIETILPGTVAVPVKNDEQFTAVCHSLIKQSADAIYITETSETNAEAVMRTSTQSNIVITTLHANSACDVILRLNVLTGYPYNLIVNVLQSVVYQRLVRVPGEDRQVPLCRYIEFTNELKQKLYDKPLGEMYSILAKYEKGDNINA